MKKINQVFYGVIIIALFSVFVPMHSASAAWNDNTNGTDCPTTMVLNYTAGTTKTNYCYPTSVSANQGDTVNAVIYYRNTSPTTAHNVVIHLSPATFSPASSQTFNGSITSSDNGSVYGAATVNFPTAQSLTFGNVAWYPNQSYSASALLNGQSGSEIFSSGLNIGDIPGYSDCPVSGGVKNVFCHQGWIFVSFQVSSTPVANSCTISSFTANGSSGSVTIPYNTSATLAWTTNNCNSVTVNGQTYTGYQALSGSTQTGNLTYSQNYTLTASDSYGHNPSQTVNVNVGSHASACAINSFTANGSSGYATTPYNSNVTLAWNTTNCTTVFVNGQTYTGSQAISGNTTIWNVTQSQNYTMSASDSYGNNPSQSVYVTVSGQSQSNCYINSFTANGSNSTTVTYGGSANLSWTTTGCQTVSLTTNNMTYGALGTGYIPPINGNTTVGPLYTNTQYILTGYGSNGQQTSPSYVTINVNNNYYPPAPNPTTYCSIYNFTGPNYTIAYGSTAPISWGTSGCSSVVVSGPGIYSTSPTGNQNTPAIYGSSNYTLTATDYSGYQQTRTITITATGYPTPVNSAITPITTVATNITNTSARLNGILPQSSNSATVSAYFEYGTTSSLGQQTNPQTVTTYTLLNFYDTITTTPNTTYYFRAVANTNGNITRGDIASFTTSSNNTVVTPVVVNRITYGTGSGSAAASLTVTDQAQSISAGDTIFYTINYKNLSNGTLSNVVLNFILPTGVTYKFASQGTLTTNNTVLVSLGNLDKGASGTINVQGSIDNSVVAGSTLVATATMSFTNASGSQDSVVGYVLNNVYVPNGQNSSLAGLALFGGGFFPTTLLGWVILIGIIIILIIVSRNYNDQRKAKQNNNVGASSSNNAVH